METNIVLAILAIIFLVILSGIFSGSETALTAASRPRLHHLARKGNRRAKQVNTLDEDKERLLGSILLGNNLANILAVALATSVFINFFGDAGVAYATVVMTATVLVFAEVLPKTYAISNPTRTALRVAPFISGLVFSLSPIVHAVQWIVRLTLRLFGIRVDQKQTLFTAMDELRHAIDLHAREGGMVKQERDMLDSILDLGEVDVAEIMIHRKNMTAVNADDPPEDIVRQVLDSTYTRLPLWRGEPENIIGVLHAKDVLRVLSEREGKIADFDFSSIVTEPWFVPETTTLIGQLGAFQRRHVHFALVVDEYGAIMGLVTLEDILEEIVGDIADEHDISVDGIEPQVDGTYLVDGKITIRDLNRQFEWDLPEEEAATIAGLIIEIAREIPEVGKEFSIHGILFTVVRRKRTQVTQLRINPPAAQSPDHNVVNAGLE